MDSSLCSPIITGLMIPSPRNRRLEKTTYGYATGFSASPYQEEDYVFNCLLDMGFLLVPISLYGISNEVNKKRSDGLIGQPVGM